MSEETIVAAYYNAPDAEAAIADLKAAGLPESAVSLHSGNAGSYNAPSAVSAGRQGSWSNPIGACAGDPSAAPAIFVSVSVVGANINHVMDILESHYTIDIREQPTDISLSAM